MSAGESTKQIGDRGEKLAAMYLENRGYMILERNYRFERAEVDIVAFKEHEIVFVEVKLRTSLKFGHPEDAVTEAKTAANLQSSGSMAL